ncbi:UDP-glucose 4-epimerase GalE [Capsulimonas corticalis]|uniref:UDP-glucose 4-epimerase n=1 Tax=Capsulimonas corticalis TaxID=2219043 RepID=A0A402CTR3_9BACT|nr:UDP-glucose 4-epimerase GalE [Capsulimonas corticalis]BDI28744.1 UDP-glucose 4-epimerase GalE [Capsulimonas corticalis]
MGSVLVTGGAGYIGSHTSKLLLKKGYDVVIYDSLELGHKEVLKYLPGAKFVQGDIGDGQLVADTVKKYDVDSMIHFAAYASVPESVGDPVKYYQNNIVKTLTLLDAINSQGVKHVLFSSSAATFGETQYVPIDEKHPQKPTNPYGQTKLDAEYILHWYDVAFGIKSVALRYFCAAGADPEGELGEDHTPETHMIPLTLFAALGRRPDIKIFGTDYPTHDGTGVRDYIHVTDLGHAHILGLEALKNGAETTAYNLGNGKGYSVREVIETGRKVTGKTIVATESPRRPGDPAELVASSAKIEKELGWKPQFGDIETIMRTAYEWFEKHPKGYASEE